MKYSETGLRAYKSAETRERILKSARHIFARDGFTNSNVRDIARFDNLSTGAIFGHFEGKADLYAQAMGKRAPTAAMMDASADMFDALIALNAALDGYWNVGPDRASGGWIRTIEAAQQKCKSVISVVNPIEKELAS